MCQGCWAEYGYPLLRTPKVLRLAADIELLEQEDCTYGNLYVVLNDWNLDDEQILRRVQDRDTPHTDRCRLHLEKGWTPPDEWTLAERACLAMLQICTEQERAAALAIEYNYTAEVRDEILADESAVALYAEVRDDHRL